MVLGYEGIGIVIKVGLRCSKIKVGDRVGVGYMFSVCGMCEYCISGKEILCIFRVVIFLVKLGIFVEYIIGYEDYVLFILSNLDIVVGVLILCGGVISYKVLK